MFETANGGLRQAVVITLVAVCVSIALRCVHVKTWNQRASLYYYDGNKPLVTTMDGYYYLRLSREYARGDFGSKDDLSPIGKKPQPFSLLPLLSASVHKVSKIPIEKIAFFLPVILSSLMALIYVAWGMVLGGPFLALASSIVGGSVYYWYTRTCLGRFDTDALIPVFTYGIPYLVYKYTKADTFRAAAPWGATAILCGIAFCLWWLPAFYASPVLIIGTYAISIFAYNRSKTERILKLCVLTAGCITSILVILSYIGLLPQFKVFRPLIGLLSLVTHSAEPAEPSISASISELAPLSLAYFKTYVAGSWAFFVFSTSGFLMLLLSRKKELIFLTIPLLAGFMSFFSRRFLIFLIPLFALSLGYFLHTSGSYLRRRYGPASAGVFAILAIAITAFSVGKRAYTTFIPPRLTAHHVAIAKAVNNGHLPSELVWSWWDYGYFLEYFTEKRVLIDGGSQGGIRPFVAAYPFVQENPAVAARWIRFFAHHGPAGIHKINRYTGGTEKTVKLLEKIFSSPQNLPHLLVIHSFPQKLDWKKYFFPESGKVYIFLPFEMIPATYWWYYYGTWGLKLNGGDPAQALILPPGTVIDGHRGVVFVNQKQLPLASLYIFRDRPEPTLYLDRYFRSSGLLAIIGKRGSYIMTSNLKDSIFFKLLFTPYSVPYFRSIKYIPEYGGIWEVLDGPRG
ncbi:STT3 domain-containing protein [Thermodesulforhabdus norvegica]|uniref:Oligosaccharyl transferase STT3 subunit n=1 Tax=Thermodesulforhabdus norvegica TaxID=39841 RepID=A0A1I4SSM0_9BACT|nr:STT3 domain-containing protein [Thermodesulforhabdus norvegica]SFM67411.1 Oligosaccharyl transferase STT3 subunit [Thermodesulforhabdus norvegica]